MTESIFDPTGPETEHSGTRNLGPDAASGSHMPPEMTDAKVDEDDRALNGQDDSVKRDPGRPGDRAGT